MKPKFLRRLEALEGQYRAELTDALTRCAQGRWGLFGQNNPVIAPMNARERQRHEQTPVEDLLRLGTDIDRLRHDLGVPGPFAPHERLMRFRSAAGPNTVGEPKLAEQWLLELQAEREN